MPTRNWLSRSGLKARHLTPLVMAPLSSSDFTAGEDITTLMGIHGRISWPGLAKGTLVMRVAMRWDSSTVQFTTAPSEEQLGTKQTGVLEVGVDVIDLSI